MLGCDLEKHLTNSYGVYYCPPSTIGVVELVAVVVHVAKFLAVVAVLPSVRMHRVDLVETAGV